MEPVEIVEAHTLVIVSERPGEAIEANFDAVRAFITSIVEGYAELVITEQDVPKAKKDRAYLNSISASLGDRRKAVKARYMAPLVAFEAKVAELDAPIREGVEAIDKQVKAFEAKEKSDKRGWLVEHYNTYAGALADAVPFDHIEDSKWLNKTCDLAVAFDHIEVAVERMVRDEAALTDLDLSHPVEAKAEYFATLDLSRAIAVSKELDARLERARKLEEDKAENARWIAEKAAEKAAETVPDVPPLVVEEPEIREWTFIVKCTEAELGKITAAIKALGLHGSVKGA